MANSALGQTGFGADAIATSNIQNSAVTVAKIADDTITEAKLAASATLQLATMQASTSGTRIDFTGIPAGTKEIVVMLSGVSTNGTSVPIIQIGDAGGIETTGYLGGSADYAAYVDATTGFAVGRSWAAGFIAHGMYTLRLMVAATNRWVCYGGHGDTGGLAVMHGGGSKALSAELDRVRITMTNGTDAFDAGSINIAYK